MPKPRVASICLKWDGIAYYREQLPLLELAKEQKIDFLSPRKLYEADIVLLDRVFLPPFNHWLFDLKQHGIRVIYGIDDDPFNVPAHHPSFELYHQADVQRHMISALESADLIIAATGHLKTILQEKLRPGTRIDVIGNYLDFKSDWNAEDFQLTNPYYKPENKVIIGWAGSPVGHKADLALLRGVLQELVKRYGEKLLFRFMGHCPEFIAEEVPPGNVEFQSWVNVKKFPTVLRWLGIDIGLIPLEDTLCNRSKTNLKYLEFSALQIPAVLSHVGPYRGIPGDCGILTENTRDGWIRAITQLIENPKCRVQMGWNAFTYVKSNYDISHAVNPWYESLMSVEPDFSRQPFVVTGTCSPPRPNPVDVILSVSDEIDDPRTCIDSILQYTDLSWHTLIVIDDGTAKKEWADYLNSLSADGIRLLRREKAGGFVASCNEGMRVSENDVVCLHPHIEVSKGWLDKITRCAYSNPNIGTVSPLMNGSGLLDTDIQGLQEDVTEINDRLEEKSLPYYDLPFGNGSCIFIKRNVLTAYGTFDLTLGNESGYEIDFCLKVKPKFKSVLDTHTFVYNRSGDGASGSPPIGEPREKNAQILQERYPLYKTQLQLWKESDTVRGLRTQIQDLLNMKPLFIMSLLD